MIESQIERLLSECDKHLARMHYAAAKMRGFMPLNPESFQRLREDEIASIDQYLFRLAKLQDAIGERLMVLFLEYLQEPNPKGKPFMDILSRLEQLGWLEDRTTWLELRKIRNSIAHQYEDEPELAAEGLNAIFTKGPVLDGIYTRLKVLYRAKLSERSNPVNGPHTT
jgi:hypothetical protein